MKRHIFLLSKLLLVSGLSACNSIPIEAHYNRGAPESLLDISSEVVSVELVSEQSVDEIVNWIETDHPSRAELNCFEGDPLCIKSEDVLKLYGLDYEVIASDRTEVLLVYERVIARDCESRYIDNSVNPYNLHSPTYGCSVAANMLQMVTDKRQFVSPALLDYMDAASAIRGYNSFVFPATENESEKSYDVSDVANQ